MHRLMPSRADDGRNIRARPGMTSAHTAETTRVLIADDNHDWADGLAVLLAEEGFSVRVAYDGLEAVEAARTFHPRVVVLDIRMPRLDGYDTARIFNRHPAKTRPVLIAVTAWPGDTGQARAKMAGFDHYLTKPADPAELLELLSGV